LTQGKTLEGALLEVQGEADTAQRSLAELARTVKAVRSAAASGKIGDIEKGLSNSQQELELLNERLGQLSESWVFDTRSYFESGGYEKELLEAIENEGLQPVSRDGRILCFPSILRLLVSDVAVEIDRKKERRIRPTVIAQELRKHEGKKTGVRPEQLIEILHEAYEPLVARQTTRIVRLAAIYDLLTLLPQASDYSKQEFARDLLQLDMSSVRATRGGEHIRFHAATTARSGTVLTAVTRQGDIKIYSSVEFDE
jgi:hypothetical protein